MDLTYSLGRYAELEPRRLEVTQELHHALMARAAYTTRLLADAQSRGPLDRAHGAVEALERASPLPTLYQNH